jgi:maleylpyruvate isomerase
MRERSVGSVDVRALDRSVAGASDAHQRLLARLDASEGIDPRRPSRLPDWTVGHVLTHIARNADGHMRMLAGAERGAVVDQYEGGIDGRRAEIEAGAGRAWDELVADVRATIWRLEQAWATHTRWDGAGRATSGRIVPVTDLPFLRWRETEVHHVDLGFDGVTIADWPSAYVREDLRRMEMLWNARQPMGMTGLPEAALQAEPRDRLAWLLGRLELDGLPPADIFA